MREGPPREGEWMAKIEDDAQDGSVRTSRRRGLTRRLATPGRVRDVALVLAVVAIAIGGFRVAELFVSNVLITGDLYGQPLRSSGEATREFPGQAAVGLLLATLGTAVAVAARDRLAIVVGVVVLVAGVGAVLVVGDALDVWQVDLPEQPATPATDQPTCRSGEGGCPGG